MFTFFGAPLGQNQQPQEHQTTINYVYDQFGQLIPMQQAKAA